ncbi:MAG: PAS domain S-box protein [Myxococcales bacterium]
MVKVPLPSAVTDTGLGAEELWQSIAESPFEYVMLVDREGMYLYLNRVDPRLSMEDVLNKRTMFDYLDASDRPMVADVLRRVFERGENAYYEVRIPFNQRWYACIVAPIRRDDEVVVASVMARDCTREKLAEHASRQMEDRYRLIVQQTRDGVWLLDECCRTMFVNERVTEMLGYQASEMAGRSLLEFVARGHELEVRRRLERPLQGKRDLFDVCFQRSDGEELWALVSAGSTYDARGECSGTVAVLTDRSEHRRWATTLSRAQRMDLVGKLAGGLAHDFSNMLTSIIGFGTMLENTVARHDVGRTYLGHILDASERARGLVRRLLTFSRKDDYYPRAVDLNLVVADLGPILQSMLPKQVRLTQRLSAVPAYVLVDAAQLEQALLNLVVNARDAISGEGEIEVRVIADLGPTHERAAHDGLSVALCVRDSGGGIEPAVLRHIFEPFYTTKESQQGTGLGLAIVYSFAQQSGADVSVESMLGQGTEFTLRFRPCAEH